MPAPVAPITLTAAGLSPDRADRATFVARSIARDDFIKNTQIPQLQTAIDNVFNNATEAYNSGVSATANAASSSINASQAAAAATATQWISGTSYAVGDARWSPVTKISYRRLIAGAGTTDPSADATNWAAIAMPLAAGGTGATTAVAARAALGSTTTGDAVFIAATPAAARTALEAMHSGYMQVQDQKASGTAGGAAIAGVNNRTLNTVVANTITGASVASNIITLPIGTYRFRGESMVVADTVATHVTPQLYNNTVGAVTLIGLRAYLGVGTANTASVSGRFTLNATTALVLRNQFTSANANGFGLSASFGTTEVYSNIEIWKE